MTSIIITTIICITVITCVVIISNTATTVTKISCAGMDAAALEAVQTKLDEAYVKEQDNTLTLNKVLEALDDEYGIEERDGR